MRIPTQIAPVMRKQKTLRGRPSILGIRPQACTAIRHDQLQAHVNAACKGVEGDVDSQGGFGCLPTDGCATLLSNRNVAYKCAEQRDLINADCFNGGDVGHQAAAQAARSAQITVRRGTEKSVAHRANVQGVFRRSMRFEVGEG